jgi:hypothetical protein
VANSGSVTPIEVRAFSHESIGTVCGRRAARAHDLVNGLEHRLDGMEVPSLSFGCDVPRLLAWTAGAELTLRPCGRSPRFCDWKLTPTSAFANS